MAEPAAPPQPEASNEIPPAGPTTGLALYCPACMYDLRGLPGDQCPECGTKLDREKLAKSSIPWVHREGLGIGAFLKTAMRATFKTEFFSMEVARPVSLADARKFRRLVVAWLMIAVALIAAMVLLLADDVHDPLEEMLRNQPVLLLVAGGLAVVLVWLFMMAFTGLHTYWFHPKALSVPQQNRAVALSHYACAPLIGLVPAVILYNLAFLLGTMNDHYESVVMISAAIILAMASVLLVVLSLTSYLFVCARMARHAAHCGGLAQFTLWLGLPALWLGLAGLIFVVLPVVGLYFYLMVTSL